MSEILYNQALLRLASAIPHEGRLTGAHASTTRVSPICGSRVIAHVALDEHGKVARFAQEVRACALGQAAAAMLGADILGRTPEELAALSNAVAAYLLGDAQPPSDQIALFAPALPYRARHPSIRLAFEAAAAAAEAARLARPIADAA